jgi:hypothetical protein
VDEFTKSITLALLGGGLVGAIITKVLDFWFASLQDKRNFRRSRREKACAEIEELRNQISAFYALCINWDEHKATLPDFAIFMAKEHEVISRCSKYPEIAAPAQDTIHFCKIAISDARKQGMRERVGDETLRLHSSL